MVVGNMPNTTQKEYKHMPFSNEEVFIVSKADPCVIWAGSKIVYSGAVGTGAVSGYNFYSGESDVEPVNASGWGRIRIPELNQLHQIFVFPNNPGVIARGDYTELDCSVGVSGYPAGCGKCSGKMALIHYTLANNARCILSGEEWVSGMELDLRSGIFEIVAFGSQM